MGLKNKKALMSILMMGAMMSEGMGTGFEHILVDTSKPYKPPINKVKPFKEQDGIVSLIKEYNLIQKGECKKGKRKQERTIRKLAEMIENGHLTYDDLKL